MRLLQALATTVLTLAVAAAVAAGAWWLVTNKPAASKPDKPAPAATVGKVVKEDDLNSITLTEAAEKRLGLQTGNVERKSARRVRMYGGEVTVPAGRTIPVAAPLSGTLRAPADGLPKAGQAIKAGQHVFELLPLLTPDGRASLSAALTDAEGQLNGAKTQLELAKIAQERARRVLREGAGSQRQVDEAQAAFDLATKTVDAATARRAILLRVVGDVDNGTAAPLAVDAPCAGILRAVSALPGQTVPSGAALFEIVDLSTVWLRVPLPVGDLDNLDRTASAQAGSLAASGGRAAVLARPVAAPPSASSASATVDAFYELANTDGRLTPGQRLGVTVPLTDAQESLTVPWSAVVIDVHGGSWVYESTGSRRFVRRRVVVGYTIGSEAVLASGPTAGTAVVTAGVQELFGAETGFVK